MKHKQKTLDKIEIPQMTDDKVSLESIESADGLILMVMRYSNPSKNDLIKIYWDNMVVKQVLLNDIQSDLPVTVKITNKINEGEHIAYYTIRDSAQNENSSEKTKVIIVNERHSSFESPIFINAVNNTLTQESIHANKGTKIYVEPQNNILTNDVMTLFISAVNSAGNNIYNASLPRVITFNEVNVGVEFLIQESILKTLVGCYISAYYHIVHLKSLIGISKKAQVKIIGDHKEGKLKIYSSTDAANIDTESISVNPYNHGIIVGKPGETVTLSVTQGAEFYESGANIYDVTLNRDGMSNFKLSANRQGLFYIAARDKNNPEIIAGQCAVNFKPYYYENELIPYVNYSTGAPADGITPCTIYLMTTDVAKFSNNTKINVVRVSVDGNAKIVGYNGQSADISLHADQSTEIYIVSNSPGSITVTITLPQSTGTPVRLPLSFVKVDN